MAPSSHAQLLSGGPTAASAACGVAASASVPIASPSPSLVSPVPSFCPHGPAYSPHSAIRQSFSSAHLGAAFGSLPTSPRALQPHGAAAGFNSTSRTVRRALRCRRAPTPAGTSWRSSLCGQPLEPQPGSLRSSASFPQLFRSSPCNAPPPSLDVGGAVTTTSASLGASSADKAHPDALTVTFTLQQFCEFKQEFFVVGSHPALGCWDVNRAVPLTWNPDHKWTGKVQMPAGDFEYKYILKGAYGELLAWRPGQNLDLHLTHAGAAAGAGADGSTLSTNEDGPEKRRCDEVPDPVDVDLDSQAAEDGAASRSPPADGFPAYQRRRSVAVADSWYGGRPRTFCITDDVVGITGGHVGRRRRRLSAGTLSPLGISRMAPGLGNRPRRRRVAAAAAATPAGDSSRSGAPGSRTRMPRAVGGGGSSGGAVSVSIADSPAETGTATVQFQMRRQCEFQQRFYIVGACPELGAWDEAQAVPMVWTDGDVWTAVLDIRADGSGPVEYKYLLRGAQGEMIEWQPGENQSLPVLDAQHPFVSVSDDWLQTKDRVIEFAAEMPASLAGIMERQWAENVATRLSTAAPSFQEDMDLDSDEEFRRASNSDGGSSQDEADLEGDVVPALAAAGWWLEEREREEDDDSVASWLSDEEAAIVEAMQTAQALQSKLEEVVEKSLAQPGDPIQEEALSKATGAAQRVAELTEQLSTELEVLQASRAAEQRRLLEDDDDYELSDGEDSPAETVSTAATAATTPAPAAASDGRATPELRRPVWRPGDKAVNGLKRANSELSVVDVVTMDLAAEPIAADLGDDDDVLTVKAGAAAEAAAAIVAATAKPVAPFPGDGSAVTEAEMAPDGLPLKGPVDADGPPQAGKAAEAITEAAASTNTAPAIEDTTPTTQVLRRPKFVAPADAGADKAGVVSAPSSSSGPGQGSAAVAASAAAAAAAASASVAAEASALLSEDVQPSGEAAATAIEKESAVPGVGSASGFLGCVEEAAAIARNAEEELAKAEELAAAAGAAAGAAVAAGVSAFLSCEVEAADIAANAEKEVAEKAALAAAAEKEAAEAEVVEGEGEDKGILAKLVNEQTQAKVTLAKEVVELMGAVATGNPVAVLATGAVVVTSGLKVLKDEVALVEEVAEGVTSPKDAMESGLGLGADVAKVVESAVGEERMARIAGDVSALVTDISEAAEVVVEKVKTGVMNLVGADVVDVEAEEPEAAIKPTADAADAAALAEPLVATPTEAATEGEPPVIIEAAALSETVVAGPVQAAAEVDTSVSTIVDAATVADLEVSTQSPTATGTAGSSDAGSLIVPTAVIGAAALAAVKAPTSPAAAPSVAPVSATAEAPAASPRPAITVTGSIESKQPTGRKSREDYREQSPSVKVAEEARASAVEAEEVFAKRRDEDDKVTSETVAALGAAVTEAAKEAQETLQVVTDRAAPPWRKWLSVVATVGKLASAGAKRKLVPHREGGKMVSPRDRRAAVGQVARRSLLGLGGVAVAATTFVVLERGLRAIRDEEKLAEIQAAKDAAVAELQRRREEEARRLEAEVQRKLREEEARVQAELQEAIRREEERLQAIREEAVRQEAERLAKLEKAQAEAQQRQEVLRRYEAEKAKTAYGRLGLDSNKMEEPLASSGALLLGGGIAAMGLAGGLALAAGRKAPDSSVAEAEPTAASEARAMRGVPVSGPGGVRSNAGAGVSTTAAAADVQPVPVQPAAGNPPAAAAEIPARPAEADVIFSTRPPSPGSAVRDGEPGVKTWTAADLASPEIADLEKDIESLVASASVQPAPPSAGDALEDVVQPKAEDMESEWPPTELAGADAGSGDGDDGPTAVVQPVGEEPPMDSSVTEEEKTRKALALARAISALGRSAAVTELIDEEKAKTQIEQMVGEALAEAALVDTVTAPQSVPDAEKTEAEAPGEAVPKDAVMEEAAVAADAAALGDTVQADKAPVGTSAVEVDEESRIPLIVFRPEDAPVFSGVAMLPHPAKEKKGGEDAYMIVGGVLGVADGVSGWAEDGIDPALYSRALMRFAAEAFVEKEVTGNTATLLAMDRAHRRTKLPGSATACIVEVAEGRLYAANLGDSGYMVIRKGSVIARSSPQQHSFNCPFQLACADLIEYTDSADDADFTVVPLEPGDAVVVATDGLFDNVFDNDIATIIKHYSNVMTEGTAEAAANALVDLAREHGLDESLDSPFSRELTAEDIPLWRQVMGERHYGGKLDDVTVVVAWVR